MSLTFTKRFIFQNVILSNPPCLAPNVIVSSRNRANICFALLLQIYGNTYSSISLSISSIHKFLITSISLLIAAHFHSLSTSTNLQYQIQKPQNFTTNHFDFINTACMALLQKRNHCFQSNILHLATFQTHLHLFYRFQRISGALFHQQGTATFLRV